MKKLFNYFEPLWTGNDNRISLRSVGAIALLVDFIRNISFAIHKWEVGKSYADVAMLLGIEAGLAATLLGLKMLQNNITKIIPNQSPAEVPTPKEEGA